MGNRASLEVASGGSSVYLYTHWNGEVLPEVLKAGLIRGESRWDDAAYLARILFCEMVKGVERDTTGYGISAEVCDGRLITVDCDTQSVSWAGRSWSLSFAEFVALEKPTWGGVE